jgi:hypothetical protein
MGEVVNLAPKREKSMEELSPIQETSAAARTPVCPSARRVHTKNIITSAAYLFALLLVFSCCKMVLQAQGTSGSILGTVKDQNDSVIPGAKVTVLNTLTGLRREMLTNQQGDYEFGFLPIGEYSVTTERGGFSNATVEGIKLEVNQKARVDLQMQIGTIGETVRIERESLVETESSTMGEVITGQQIVNLPLENRQFLGLVGLVPGTAPAPRDFRSTEPGGRGVVIPSSNGGRPEDNNYELDGIDNREIGRANYAISPSIDGVAEFKVSTGIMSAEHGRVASAAVEVVTKSGTNDFHGSAFEFHRNDAFDARNFFARTVSPLKRNQFGGSIGGPIMRNKHFFFAAFERFIERRSGDPVVGNVPTENMRRGIFPSTIRDTLNGNVPFPNNTIPDSRIDPISRKILSFIPLPNNSDPLRNFIYQRDPTKTDKYLFTIRTDHQLSSNDQLNGRYIMDDEKIIQSPILPTGVGGLNSSVRAQGISIQETHIFSPTVLNQLSIGWTKFQLKEDDNFAGVRDIAAELGITLVGLNGAPEGWAFPSITLSGFLSPSGTFTRPRSTNIHQIRDTVSITRGNHTIRTGGDVRRYSSDNFSPGQLNGAFNFDNSFTGNSFANFLLGWPLNAARNLNPAEQNGKVTYFSGFVADDWKVTPRLTLNLGVRYEIETVLEEAENEVARFDLASGRVLFPEAIRSTIENYYTTVRPDVPFGFYSGGLYNQDKNNIAPRIGFAYRPFSGNRTVVRGGFGIYYNAPQITTLLSAVAAPPFSIRPTEVSSSSTPQVRWNPVGGLNQAQQGALTCFCFIQDDFPYAYSQQWALTLQQSLTNNLLVDVGYVGSHTLNLLSQPNVNVPPPGQGNVLARSQYPQWARVQAIYAGFSAKYNGLSLKVEKRAADGLSFLAAYTFAKTIDQASNTNVIPTGHPQNRLDVISGLADFDVRHRLSISYNYEFPIGPGRRFGNNLDGVAGIFLKGWGIRGITFMQSGYPVDITMSNARLNSGPGIIPRPNRLADGNLPSDQRTLNRWFDTSAFQLPPMFVIGNAGRNVITGPGYVNFDMSLFKNTQITERQRLELRAEFFNAFNHPNFGLPGANISTPQTFGVITSASAPRIIQLGVKYYF